jgi:hypothetical protein
MGVSELGKGKDKEEDTEKRVGERVITERKER